MLRYLMLFAALTLPCVAQLVTVMVPLAPSRDSPITIDIDIPAGKAAEFIHLVGDGLQAIKIHGTTMAIFRDSTSSVSTASNRITIPGPITATIWSVNNYTPGICIYRLIDNVAPSAQSHVPSNSVVIPANATGNVQVILESSVDLITWTAANPGTYSSSTEKRFFRVRTVAP